MNPHSLGWTLALLHIALRVPHPRLLGASNTNSMLILQASLGIFGEPLLGELTGTSISPAGKQVVLEPVGVVLRPVGEAKIIQLEPAGFRSVKS